MSLVLIATPREAADQQLRNEVAHAIRERIGRKGEQLRIVVESGAVTVCGRLQSFYDKQLSLHAAKNVPGVATLVDELEVAYPSHVLRRDDS